MMSPIRSDSRRPAGAAKMVSCVGLVVVVGVLDFLTGSEIGFSVFYLIPVAIGTWQLGVRAGIFVAGCSALAWWIDDALLGGRVYSHAMIPVWNAFMRFGVFVLISVMLARLRTALAAEQKSLRQLSQAYADLDRDRKEQLALKDRLLSHVSHELRTPLTAIHQFVTIPLDGLAGPLSEMQRECLQTALRNVDQLRELIGDLLVSARVDSGKFSIEPQAIALREVARETLHSLSVTAKKKIRLSERIPPDLPEVWADPSRVRQVLYNLVDNALKFTPGRGKVTVEAAVVEEEPESSPSRVPATHQNGPWPPWIGPRGPAGPLIPACPDGDAWADCVTDPGCRPYG